MDLDLKNCNLDELKTQIRLEELKRRVEAKEIAAREEALSARCDLIGEFLFGSYLGRLRTEGPSTLDLKGEPGLWYQTLLGQFLRDLREWSFYEGLDFDFALGPDPGP